MGSIDGGDVVFREVSRRHTFVRKSAQISTTFPELQGLFQKGEPNAIIDESNPDGMKKLLGGITGEEEVLNSIRHLI